MTLVTQIPNSELCFADRKHLGNGEHGAVTKASYNGQPVAVKYFNHTSDIAKKNRLATKAYEDELACYSQLSHSTHANLIKLIGYNATPTYSMLVFEFMPDVLDEYMSKSPIPPISITLRMLFELADAVRYLHDHNLLHCDIKSSNILVNALHLKLCDLSLAVAILKDNLQKKTKDRGSPMWCAPELLSKHGENTTQTDIYAMIVTFCELIAWTYGPLLYPQRDLKLFDKIINNDLRPTIPCEREKALEAYPKVRDLITFGLSKDPAKRGSAESISQALIAFKI
jgi:serine/threonine protein kinase